MARGWDNIDSWADDAYNSYTNSNPSYSSGSSYQDSLGGSGYSDWSSGEPDYGNHVNGYGNSYDSSGNDYGSHGGGGATYLPPTNPAAPKWEIRNGYVVPVGTDAGWKPGDPHANPYGSIDAVGWTPQLQANLIQSVVGDNYTTSKNARGDTIYHSNWDKDQQALFDSKFAGYAQQNYPDYFNSYEEAQARLAEQQRLEAQKIGNLLTTPQGHQVATGQATVPDYDPYMIAAMDALGSGNQENVEKNADATNFTNREGAAIAGTSVDGNRGDTGVEGNGLGGFGRSFAGGMSVDGSGGVGSPGSFASGLSSTPIFQKTLLDALRGIPNIAQNLSSEPLFTSRTRR